MSGFVTDEKLALILQQRTPLARGTGAVALAQEVSEWRLAGVWLTELLNDLPTMLGEYQMQLVGPLPGSVSQVLGIEWETDDADTEEDES